MPLEPQCRTSSYSSACCSTTQMCALVSVAPCAVPSLATEDASRPSPAYALKIVAMVLSPVEGAPFGSQLPYHCRNSAQST